MVYLLLADGFEEIEALTPADVLRRGGVELKTVSTKDTGDKTVLGAHGIPVRADVSLCELNKEDMEMIILPGGSLGTDNLDKCAEVHSLLTYAFSNNLFIAAICAAPKILGYDGILSGKTATCYPGMDKYLIGAHKTDARVERDGNIITSNGMGSSLCFALELLRALTDEKTAQRVAKEILA